MSRAIHSRFHDAAQASNKIPIRFRITYPVGDLKSGIASRCFHFLRVIGVLGFCFIHLQPAFAQSSVPDVTERYFQKIWQSDEGLPNNIVTTILQTRDGFLWIGTLNGLVRFDGVSFETFTPSNIGSAANRILQLCEDRNGTLWIATDGGGLAFLTNGNFHVLTKEDGLAHNRVETIAEDAEGVIWVGTFGGGINRIEGGEISEFKNAGTLVGRKLTALVRDSDGNLWFNSMHALSLFDGDKLVAVRERPNESGQILASQSGGIWYVNHAGIERITATNEVYKSAALFWNVKRGEVLSLMEDRSGALWIGTHGSDLFRFRNGRLEQLDTPHSNILSLTEDNEGSVWVGTEGGGLNRVRARAFVIYNATHGLPKDVVLSIGEAPDGGVFVVPQGAGLWKFNGEIFSHFNEHGTPNEQSINCVVSGRDGSIWLGTAGNGFYRFKDNQLTQFGRQQGLSGNDVRTLLVDSQGDVWAGTVKHGLRRLRKGKISSYSNKKGLSGNGIRALAEDRAGNIWVGNVKGNLDRISGDTIRNFTKADGLTGDSIWTLFPTGDGSIWIGTAGGGLLRFKDDRFSRITTAQGLHSDGISQIVEDDAGHLWFGSGQGIFRVEKSSLDELADGKRERIESIPYGKSEGLPSIQCTHGYQPAACKTRDGQLWFSTSKGALRLNQATTEIARTPLRIHIDKILLNEKTVSNEARFSIPPGNHRIEFHFTSPSFVAPDQITFRYQLEGFDPAWIDSGAQRSASYAQLPPGNYTFRVAARDHRGVWENQNAIMSFSVQPALWQTLWFRIAALLLFTATIVVIVRFVLRRRYQRELRLIEQQHAVERERARIAKDMHDDVGASLTQIAFLSDLAQKELESPNLVQPHLRRIGQRSREVVQALDEIVWAVNPRNDTLTSLVEYLSHFIDDYIKPTKIRCHQELPDTLPDFALASEFRHNLFLIIKEALNNAVKHAGASEIRFVVKISESVLDIVMEDNGRGFSTGAEAPLSDGLKNMRERTAQLGGTFCIESVPGRGTKIILKLPLQR